MMRVCVTHARWTIGNPWLRLMCVNARLRQASFCSGGSKSTFSGGRNDKGNCRSNCGLRLHLVRNASLGSFCSRGKSAAVHGQRKCGGVLPIRWLSAGLHRKTRCRAQAAPGCTRCCSRIGDPRHRNKPRRSSQPRRSSLASRLPSRDDCKARRLETAANQAERHAGVSDGAISFHRRFACARNQT